MNRTTVALIEALPDSIDARRDKAARLRDKLTDPARASYNDVRMPHDVKSREIALTENIDKAAEIDKEADRLQAHLDKLRAELLQDLEDNPPIHKRTGLTDYETRRIVKMHLAWGCSWEESAELAGYCIKTCQSKFDRWLAAL